MTGSHEVRGSIPLGSTIDNLITKNLRGESRRPSTARLLAVYGSVYSLDSIRTGIALERGHRRTQMTGGQVGVALSHSGVCVPQKSLHLIERDTLHCPPGRGGVTKVVEAETRDLRPLQGGLLRAARPPHLLGVASLEAALVQQVGAISLSLRLMRLMGGLYRMLQQEALYGQAPGEAAIAASREAT